MTLSDHLAAKVALARQERQVEPPAPFLSVGLLAVGVAGFGVILASLMPPVPPSPALTPVPAPAQIQQPAPVSVDQPGGRCVPYASNGTYLPELCGEHDAFSEKYDRVKREPAQ